MVTIDGATSTWVVYLLLSDVAMMHSRESPDRREREIQR